MGKGENGGRERRERKKQQNRKENRKKKGGGRKKQRGWPVSFFSTIYSVSAGEVHNCCVTWSTKKPDKRVLADGEQSGQEAGDSSNAGSASPPL